MSSTAVKRPMRRLCPLKKAFKLYIRTSRRFLLERLDVIMNPRSTERMISGSVGLVESQAPVSRNLKIKSYNSLPKSITQGQRWH